MKACLVVGCPGDGDFLVRFPPVSDARMYSLWLRSCRLQMGEDVEANARVCSLHFIDNDFESLSRSSWLMTKKTLKPKTHPWRNLDLGFKESVDRVACCIRGCPSDPANDKLFKFPSVLEPSFREWMAACTLNGEKQWPENFADAYICSRHFPELGGTTNGPLSVGTPRAGLVAHLPACCCVPNCRTTNSFNAFSGQKPVPLVSWPLHDAELLLRWLDVFEGDLDRHRVDVSAAKVCMKHFPMSQFAPGDNKLKRKFVLRRDAVPAREPPAASRMVFMSGKSRCCVDNCFNALGKLFRFPPPSDWQLRKQWVRACLEDGNTVANPDAGLVCARHFAPEDFVQARGGGKRQTVHTLHPTAVPEIFDLCAFRDCVSNRSGDNRGLHFFGFPVSKADRETWFAATSITPKKRFRIESAKVCHRHFDKSCFEGGTGGTRLKVGSIPTLTVDGGGGRLTKNFNKVKVKRLTGSQIAAHTKGDVDERFFTGKERSLLAGGRRKKKKQQMETDLLKKLKAPIVPSQSVGVQVDSIKDISTLSCLSKIDYLQRVEEQLDAEIITLEIENHELKHSRDKIVFACPVLLQ